MTKSFLRIHSVSITKKISTVYSAYSHWQGFQCVVRTMLWEEIAQGLSDDELAEIEDEIREIRRLLNEDDIK